MKSKVFFLVFTALTLCFVEAQAQSWPYGKADWQEVSVTAGTAEATVNNDMVFLRIDTLSANSTLHLDFVGRGPRNGSLLFIDVRSDGTARSLTAGDKLQFPAITGVINKGKLLALVYDSGRGKYVIFSERQYD